MANRFSDIAKQMGAKVEEEVPVETIQNVVQDETAETKNKVEIQMPSKSLKTSKGNPLRQDNQIPTTRKTTALPLVLDIAIKEVKERRNIASKIRRSKKITEDDVVIEALELYFKKAENKPFLEAAYEKIKYLE